MLPHATHLSVSRNNAADARNSGNPLVAALNLSAIPGDVDGNLRMAEQTIIEAKRENPSLAWVVLPELFTCAYSSLATIYRHAEDAEAGTSARRFSALARELGIYVVYGFPEQASNSPGVFDSANLVGPDGVLATYRKRNLVRTTGEELVFVPGETLPVIEVNGLRVTLMICWDLGFPEVAREAAIGGADLILAPAAWRDPWGPQYDLSCAARALDSGVFLASANQLGVYPEACFDRPGHVYGPDGLRVSRLTGTTSLGEIVPGFSRLWRARFGSTLLNYDRAQASLPVP
jgi:predicted amidohydrolase